MQSLSAREYPQNIGWFSVVCFLANLYFPGLENCLYICNPLQASISSHHRSLRGFPFLPNGQWSPGVLWMCQKFQATITCTVGLSWRMLQENPGKVCKTLAYRLHLNIEICSPVLQLMQARQCYEFLQSISFPCWQKLLNDNIPRWIGMRKWNLLPDGFPASVQLLGQSSQALGLVSLSQSHKL